MDADNNADDTENGNSNDSFSDDDAAAALFNDEVLVENLKGALAERERRMLQELDTDNSPPPLPPKMRGRQMIDQHEEEPKRVIDFTEANYQLTGHPSKKRKYKRSHSFDLQRKSQSNVFKPGDPLYRRSALVSLHPVSSNMEPIGYDPLKLAESDDDHISNLVQQANDLEIRPYNEKQNESIEIVYPSYQRPSQPKKNLKSVFPEVFSKLAEDRDQNGNEEIEIIERDRRFSTLPQNFEAIRSRTLPHGELLSPNAMFATLPRKGARSGICPSDFTDFDSVSSEKQTDNEAYDTFAYDTVADQTDAETVPNSPQTGSKIVCDKYRLCGNMNDKFHKTFPRRTNINDTEKARPNLDSIAIALSDPSSGSNVRSAALQPYHNSSIITASSLVEDMKDLKRTVSLDLTEVSREQRQKSRPMLHHSEERIYENYDTNEETDCFTTTASRFPRSHTINYEGTHAEFAWTSSPLNFQPPPLITAVKHISSPQVEEEALAKQVIAPQEPPDRILEFDASTNRGEDLAATTSIANENPPTEVAAEETLLHQQQQLVQQLRELNELQKQQLDSQQQQQQQQQQNAAVQQQLHLEGSVRTGAPSVASQPDVNAVVVAQSVSPMYNMEPIVVTSQVERIDTQGGNMVIEVANPFGGRTLSVDHDEVILVTPSAPPAEVNVEHAHGADSGIDLTNYDNRISTESEESDSDEEEEAVRQNSMRNKIQKANTIKRMKRWYKDVYLKPGCCFSCLGAFIFFINFIFFIIAGAFFGLGVYGLYDLLLDRIKDPYLAMIDPMFAMSVLGFTMLLVTLSGMIGFCKGKICLIKFFAVFLIALCILFTGGGITFWVWKAETTVYISDTVFHGLIKHYSPESNRIVSRFTIDQIQEQFQCCGMNSIDVWKLNSNYPCVNETCALPESCCLERVTCSSTSFARHNATCMDSMGGFIDNHVGIIAGVWGGFMLIVIIQLICTHYMIREVTYRDVIKREIKHMIDDHVIQHFYDGEYPLKKKNKKKKKKKRKNKKKKKSSKKKKQTQRNAKFTNPAFEP